MNYRDVGLQRFCAFTVAELGEMLPGQITVNEEPKCFEVRKRPDIYFVRYSEWENDNAYIYKTAETEADARAKMLVYLLENKLITF